MTVVLLQQVSMKEMVRLETVTFMCTNLMFVETLNGLNCMVPLTKREAKVFFK